MITTRRDTRTVLMDITGAGRAPIDRSHTSNPDQLIPDRAEVVLDVAAGTVERVEVTGAKVTDSGAPHAIHRRVWSWVYYGGPEVWPPPGAPAVALAAVAHALPELAAEPAAQVTP